MRFWNRAALAALGAVAAASAWAAAGTPLGNDYLQAGPGADDAGPQIDALIHGDLSRFFSEQSFLGPVSLVLRAPFAALGGDDFLAQYRFGVFPCMLALGIVALALAYLAVERGAKTWHGAILIAVVMFAGPAANALRAGHPEELLTAALVLAAALTAARGKENATAVLAGTAIATKPWAALALVPIALATTRPLRTLFTSAATGVLLLAPMALANTDAFRDATRAANDIHRIRPLSVWWLLKSDGDLPGAVETGIRPALLAVSALLAWAAARRGTLTLERLLALLAFVFLLRAALDPGDNAYYHVPFIAALGSWELVAARRPPVLAFAAGLLLTDTFLGQLGTDNDVRSIVYLAWVLPLGAYIATRVAPARDPAAGVPARVPPGDA